MKLSKSILVIALAAASGSALANADLIFTNGDIVTVTGEADRAQAVAIKNSKIIAVGSNADVLKEQGSNTEVRDLGGKTMTPGFIDSHGHFSQYLPLINSPFVYPSPLGNSDSLPAIQTMIAEYLAQPGLDKDRLHFAFGYDNTELVEQRHPTRWELDDISGDFALCLVHISGHLAVCNSKGLDVIGYNKDTPAPAGGVIHKTKEGELTGLIEESATYAMFPHLNISPQELVVNLAKVQDMFMSYGVTTAQEGLAMAHTMRSMKQMADNNLLKIDLLSYAKWTDFEGIINDMPALGKYHNNFKFAGMKITGDGSPQGKTAYLSTPYFEVPHSHAYHYHGYPVLNQEEMNHFVDIAFKHNAQLISHANGDAAADQLINAVEKANKKYGERDHRTTIIHGQTARLDQIQRMVEANMMASFFPAHTYFWGDYHKKSVLGPWRASNISPMGWANEYGLKFTIHMDAPVVYPDQMRNMWTAVNRITRSGETLGEWHKISPYQALEAVTIHAAYQNFEDAEKGTVEVGKRADLVILEANPLDVDPMVIKDIKVLETIKDGNTVFTL
ncbi:amidohydrolase [Photobacterium lutimaris]|uniref:Transcriptional regulator n=1 Tax=Photobacterium lutimaris TaxID=388278 RepID=A0A2T3IUU9_9GAMM|nr:amidohydrolase [Photobacterium lutimaris]PSU32144.1 transcriptional regulator [Photobacterium lutimaris]